jgi:hypothetical protein
MTRRAFMIVSTPIVIALRGTLCVDARHLVEGDHAGSAVARRAGFVEADVTRPADAEDLKIEPAEIANLALIRRAEVEDFLAWQRAIGDVPVLARDVDVIEEVLAHEPHVALQLVRLHRVVFVEVERYDVLERQPLLAVHANQFVVNPRRRRPGRQPQHRRLAPGVLGPDDVGDLGGDGLRCNCRRRVDRGRNLFHSRGQCRRPIAGRECGLADKGGRGQKGRCHNVILLWEGHLSTLPPPNPIDLSK